MSQHIKKLEQQLDKQLLVRVGKSFSLTNSGQQLYIKGQQLLRLADNLEALIKQDDTYTGNVKIASPGSIGLKLYPYLLSLQQQHQSLEVDYIFAPHSSIKQNLLEQQLDIGLVTQLINSSDIISEKVAEEPLVLVTSHKIKKLDWSVLINLGFISHPDAADHAKQLLTPNFQEFEHIEQFQHKGFSNQISLILAPVSLNLGFTVLPLNAVQAFTQQDLIKIHPLKQKVSEDLYLCINRQAVQYNRVKLIKSKLTEFLF